MIDVSVGRCRRRHFYGLVCAVLVVTISFGFVRTCSQAKEAPAVPQILNDATFSAWREFIHPSKDELSWEGIRWHTTLWEGLMLAQQEQKPLMFQSMTGHPCGTT